MRRNWRCGKAGGVLLDTHVWAWTLTGDAQLSQRALSAIEEADAVLVSPPSFFEIGQKVRLGRWPEMEPIVDGLPDLLGKQGGRAAPLDPEICLVAARFDWRHRDPFDRLLAATAMRLGLPLISADIMFDTLEHHGERVSRIW